MAERIRDYAPPVGERVFDLPATLLTLMLTSPDERWMTRSVLTSRATDGAS